MAINTDNIRPESILDADAIQQTFDSIRNAIITYTSAKLPLTFPANKNVKTGTAGNNNSIHTINGSTVSTLPNIVKRKELPALPNIHVTKNTLISVSEFYGKILQVINCYLYYHFVKSKWYHKFYDDNQKIVVNSFILSVGGYVYLNDHAILCANNQYNSNNKACTHQQEQSIPANPNAGELISANNTIEKIQTLYNTWKNNLDSSTMTYNIYTCHYVCHSNYSNRVRR